MNLNVGRELTALGRLSYHELRLKFTELWGNDAGASSSRVWLIKRIAWRLQALVEGDLSERARQRAVEIANEADLRLLPPRRGRVGPVARAPASLLIRKKSRPRLRPGTILTRKYKGRMLHVRVLAKGFEFEGTLYPSLSAVAKTVSGSHCSGNLFFRVARKGGPS